MLILNRDFKMPPDGWYQFAPLGEFPHAGACVIQVVDAEACTAMAARFKADAAVTNFAGLLIDFDHASMDGAQRSEAAGWVIDLENRDTGLWGHIRWSDIGEAAVKGGRYRFLSPVWSREDCVDLGTDAATGLPRLRPVRLLNAAVTNDPNLRGLRPLSNRSQEPVARSQSTDMNAAGGGTGVDNRHSSRGTQTEGMGTHMKTVIEKLLNHLGLAADTVEAVVLEKMGALPALSTVTDLQNSLRDLQTKHDALVANLKAVEGELVNRHLAEFEGIVTEKSREFWAAELISNRAAALAALGDLASMKADGGNLKPESEIGGQTRKPLHNRATARAVPPGHGAGASAEVESKAMKIRNRAHEIAKAEGVPFGVAFRRAEREVVGNG